MGNSKIKTEDNRLHMVKDTCLFPLVAAQRLVLQGLGSCQRMKHLTSTETNNTNTLTKKEYIKHGVKTKKQYQNNLCVSAIMRAQKSSKSELAVKSYGVVKLMAYPVQTEVAMQLCKLPSMCI
jgi:hypothetical protein